MRGGVRTAPSRETAHGGLQAETRGFTGLLATSFPLHYTEVSAPHLCGKAGKFLAEPLLTPPNSLLLYALRAARRQIRSQHLYIDAIDRPNKNLENVGITPQGSRFSSPRPALRDGVSLRDAHKAARIYPAILSSPRFISPFVKLPRSLATGHSKNISLGATILLPIFNVLLASDNDCKIF